MTFGTEITIGNRESSLHDIARCLLLAQVILGHMAGIALPTIPHMLHDPGENAALIAYRLLTRFGSQAAFLFVFLSGFMVAGPLFRGAVTGAFPNASAYYRKRMKRILPVAVLAILLTAALDLIATHALGLGKLYRTGLGYDATIELSWLNFFGNLAFLQPTFVHAFGSNGPLWTLGYIVQYYVLGYALLSLSVSLSIKRRPWCLPLLTLIILIGMTTINLEWAVLFLSWLAGGMTRLIRTPRKLGPALLVLGALLFVVSNVAPALVSASMSMIIGFCFVAWTRSLPEGPPQGGNRFLSFLAAETYTVYAIHYPIIVFIAATAFPSGASQTGSFTSYVLLSICMVSISTLVISKLVDRAIRARFVLNPDNSPSNN